MKEHHSFMQEKKYYYNILGNAHNTKHMHIGNMQVKQP